MLVKQFDLFNGIQKSNNHSIIIDLVKYVIESTLKSLVVTIT